MHSTALFLQSLSSSVGYNDELLKSLGSALAEDGYVLCHQEPHYLRKLASESKAGSTTYIVSILLVIVCLLSSGCASALMQGLLSLDQMEMTIKKRSGTPSEQLFASKLLPVISHHHLVLVTVMLYNACANEALPIFLNALVPEYVAIILSVTLVLFVGEIIPASILTGPQQLRLAANMLPIYYVALTVFFVVAYPVSKALDFFVGHAGVTVYNKREISTMISLQHEEGQRLSLHRQATSKDAIKGGYGYCTVHHDEVAIIEGVLKFREMYVTEVMTSIDDVYMISADAKLNGKLLFEIFKSGYSRIPVFDKDANDIIGLVLAKDLIFVEVEDETPVRSFVTLFGRQPAVVLSTDTLGEALSMFRNQGAHMALIKETMQEYPLCRVRGVITLEDIVEQIMGSDVITTEDRTEGSAFIKSTQFRDMDFARLRLLHAKIPDGHLSEAEIGTVVTFLQSKVPDVVQLVLDGHKEALVDLIRKSTVLTVTRQTPAGSSQTVQEDLIYRRGKVSSLCTLILSGSVTVTEGCDNETTTSEIGPWTLLGVDALLVPEGNFIPDFSAYVSSETLRFLSISLSNHPASSITPIEASHVDSTAVSSRMRSMSRGNVLGAHSLLERKKGLIRKAMGQSVTEFGLIDMGQREVESPMMVGVEDSKTND